LTSGAWVIEVTAPRGCKPKPGIIVHRSRVIHPDDRATVDGIPVTSVARTVVDLADVVNERELTRAVRQAEILRAFDLTAVEQVLERLPAERGGTASGASWSPTDPNRGLCAAKRRKS
jgi:hypothetical protein